MKSQCSIARLTGIRQNGIEFPFLKANVFIQVKFHLNVECGSNTLEVSRLSKTKEIFRKTDVYTYN